MAKLSGIDFDNRWRNLRDHLYTAISSVVATNVTNAILNKLGMNDDSARAAVGLSNAQLIAPDVKEVVREIFSIFAGHGREPEMLRLMHLKLVESSSSIYNASPENVRRAVDRIDNALKTSLSALIRGDVPATSPTSCDECRDWLFSRQCFWLGAPTFRANYLETLDIHRLQELANTMSEVQRPIFWAIIANVVIPSIVGTLGRRGMQLIVTGPPGAGKSHLVRSILLALGAKAVQLAKQWVDELGRFIDAQDREPGSTRAEPAVCPSLTKAIHESGTVNPLVAIEDFVFADALSPWFVSTILEVFDPDNPSLLGEANVIITSNKRLRDYEGHWAKKIAAFFDRFLVWEMEGLDEAVLSKLIVKWADEHLRNANAAFERSETKEVETQVRPRNSVDHGRLQDAFAHAHGRITNLVPDIQATGKGNTGRTPKRVTGSLVNYLTFMRYFSLDVGDENDLKSLIASLSKENDAGEEADH